MEEVFDGGEPAFEHTDVSVALSAPFDGDEFGFPVAVHAQVGIDYLVDGDDEVVEVDSDFVEGAEAWRLGSDADGDGFSTRLGKGACLNVVSRKDSREDIEFILGYSCKCSSKDGAGFILGRSSEFGDCRRGFACCFLVAQRSSELMSDLLQPGLKVSHCSHVVALQDFEASEEDTSYKSHFDARLAGLGKPLIHLTQCFPIQRQSYPVRGVVNHILAIFATTL